MQESITIFFYCVLRTQAIVICLIDFIKTALHLLNTYQKFYYGHKIKTECAVYFEQDIYWGKPTKGAALMVIA